MKLVTLTFLLVIISFALLGLWLHSPRVDSIIMNYHKECGGGQRPCN